MQGNDTFPYTGGSSFLHCLPIIKENYYPIIKENHYGVLAAVGTS